MIDDNKHCCTETETFVAPDGDDGWPGRKNGLEPQHLLGV